MFCLHSNLWLNTQWNQIEINFFGVEYSDLLFFYIQLSLNSLRFKVAVDLSRRISSSKWIDVHVDKVGFVAAWRRDRVAFVAVTASNARFPLFLTTTNCLDFLLLVAGPDRRETVPNRTYLCRELIVSSLCDCIDTETYCSELRGIIHARADFHAADYCNGFHIQSLAFDAGAYHLYDRN